MYQVNYKGLRRRESYDEVVSIIENDQTKIKHPNRVAVQILNRPCMKQLDTEALMDMQNQQDRMSKNKMKQLVYDLAIPTHRYLRHFEVPEYADYKPLRRILTIPSKRDAANQPQSAFCWGQIKKSAAQKPRIVTVFPPHPHQKRPRGHHSAFCGGSFRALTVPSHRVTTIQSDGHPTKEGNMDASPKPEAQGPHPTAAIMQAFYRSEAWEVWIGRLCALRH